MRNFRINTQDEPIAAMQSRLWDIGSSVEFVTIGNKLKAIIHIPVLAL